MKKQVWHSRFPDRLEDPEFEAFNASIGFDARLFSEEIAATAAHARALHAAGIYTDAELDAVQEALSAVGEELETGGIDLSSYEDIHTYVENRLTDLTGDAGRKIQTARSRNEQTVTAQRLFLKKALRDLGADLRALQYAALEKAEETLDVIIPGYTHLRPAQPLRFAQYFAALFFGLDRDRGRLEDAGARLDACPAGSGALAGVPFGLDRDALAGDLGFARPTDNSLDTVSDRDGQLEVLGALAILGVRLSRLAEDFILWSSPAFGFLELGATYCTSSSLMPQKKNPDGLELVRGKCGRVISDLVSLLVTLKGLPTGYQKDLQEDKEPIFDAVDTARLSLRICAGVLRGLRVCGEKTAAAVTPDCLATDMADALVKEGVPFRTAYAALAARFATATGEETGARRPGDVPSPPSLLDSVEARSVVGGTARTSIEAQIEKARGTLEDWPP
jgi:argininosuccinate lyase